MADKTVHDDNDPALFHDSVRDARPLRHRRRAPERRRIPPIPRKTLEDEAEVRREMLASDFDDPDIETGEELHYTRPGLQHGLLRKLRRGQIAIQGQLDLHGMTVAEAHVALGEFLAFCQARDLRCVRIIHGKGLSSPDRKPVLKARVNTWLQRSNDVLAFCSAIPRDGGTGAAYVLLKKRQ